MATWAPGSPPHTPGMPGASGSQPCATPKGRWPAPDFTFLSPWSLPCTPPAPSRPPAQSSGSTGGPCCRGVRAPPKNKPNSGRPRPNLEWSPGAPGVPPPLLRGPWEPARLGGSPDTSLPVAPPPGLLWVLPTTGTGLWWVWEGTGHVLGGRDISGAKEDGTEVRRGQARNWEAGGHPGQPDHSRRVLGGPTLEDPIFPRKVSSWGVPGGEPRGSHAFVLLGCLWRVISTLAWPGSIRDTGPGRGPAHRER